MKAALSFARELQSAGLLENVGSVVVDLYGSLGATGRGHGTHNAVQLGLEGEAPDQIDPDTIAGRLARIQSAGTLRLLGVHAVAFVEKDALRFSRRQEMPFHSNGMRFSACDGAGATLMTRGYYSVGGGFVVRESDDGIRCSAVSLQIRQ